MPDPFTGAIILGATALTAGTGYSIYSGERSAAAQKDAQAQAKAAADKQAKAQDEATNRANQKKPDITSIMAAAQNAANAGGASTMLTGPGGAAPSMLGGSSLLGG